MVFDIWYLVFGTWYLVFLFLWSNCEPPQEKVSDVDVDVGIGIDVDVDVDIGIDIGLLREEQFEAVTKCKSKRQCGMKRQVCIMRSRLLTIDY